MKYPNRRSPMADKDDRNDDDRRTDSDPPTTGRWEPPQYLQTEDVFGKQDDGKRKRH